MSLNYVQGTPLFSALNTVPKQYPYLTENIETEVIIIGGGVTGSILGYYFTKNHIPTVQIEKHRIAMGSTSITTSLLQYELDSNLKELEQYTTLENAVQSYKLGQQALNEIDDFIKTYGNHCHYQVRDTLLYTAKDIEVGELHTEYTLRKKYGFNVDYISQETNPFSFDLKAGVYAFNGGAELDPYLFTHQLLDVATSMGLKVYENTEAMTINYEQDYVEVITRFGYTIKGKVIVVATGFNTQLFTKRPFGNKTTTFNIATKPVKEIIGWPGRVLIRDNEDTYNYLRTTPDNRLIIGGEDISFVPGIFNEEAARTKYAILEQRLKNMFPHIPDIEVEYKYCGAFSSTKDNIGFIGKDPNRDRLYYGLGYGANGILFAVLAGLMLPSLYKGHPLPEMELFRPDRFDG